MTKFVRSFSEQTGEILPIFDRIADLPPFRETVTHRILNRFSCGFQHSIGDITDYPWQKNVRNRMGSRKIPISFGQSDQRVFQTSSLFY